MLNAKNVFIGKNMKKRGTVNRYAKNKDDTSVFL